MKRFLLLLLTLLVFSVTTATLTAVILRAFPEEVVCVECWESLEE